MYLTEKEDKWRRWQ